MAYTIIPLLRQLNLILDQRGREQMRPLGLSPSQSLALRYLLSLEGREVCATELHEEFGLSKSAISSTLKGLRQKGYLTTAENPEDDRKKQIILTGRAREINKRLDAGLARQQERLCAGLSPEQLEALEGSLRTMLSNLRREPARRCGA